MIYEIINPSDAYTIKADSLKVAAIACMMLGDGQYAFRPLEDGEEVPLFLFGGSDAWCQSHFQQDTGEAIQDVLNNHALELADCLDSCLIGDLSARKEYESALELIEPPENREKFRAKRHDQRRSSLNNIGNRAYKMAMRIRANADEILEPAPPSVLVGA